MAVCPKCSADSLKGRYCGNCGYSTKVEPAVATANEQQQNTTTPQTQDDMRQQIAELGERLKKHPDDCNNYIKLLELLIKTEKTEQAYSTFRAARALAPDNANVLKAGARILEKLGRRDEAITLLRKVFKRTPSDIDSVCNLSSLLFDSGQKEEALRILETLQKTAGSNPEILIRIAQIHLSLGDASEAQKYITRYRELAGTNRQMFILMGQTMLARKFYDGAIKNFREAIKLFPQDPEMRLGLGQAYVGMGERGQALLELEQALNKMPGNIEILLELGRLQNTLGMEEQAEMTFERVEKSPDVSGDHFLGMAAHFLERNNSPKALFYLEQAHRLSPYHPEVQKLLGETLLRQKKLDQALEIFQKAVENNARCDWAYEGIVKSTQKNNDLESRAKAQKKLLEIRKPTAEAWCDYGETLIGLKFFNQAQDAFEEAAKLDPTCVRAYQAPELIKIEKARSEGEKLAEQARDGIAKKFYLSAAERLEKALSLVPDQSDWLRMLADISLKTAEIHRASTLLAKLRAKQPDDYKSSFDLARVYEQENKVQLAIELLSSIIKDHPTELDAHLMLLRLKRSQIRGSRVELEMLDALVRNLDLELSHLRKSSAVPLLVNGYACYIFSFRSKFQQEGFARAEKAFNEVLEKFADNEDALKGLCLIARSRGDIEKALEHAKALIRLSAEPRKLYGIARLHENFQQFAEARKYYVSLRNLYPEDGHYRAKIVEMTAELSKVSSKNELMNMLSDNFKAIQNGDRSIWPLYETAIGQNLVADNSTQQEEWIKKSMLSWHKAATHPESNHWIRWGMLDCQLSRLKGNDKHKAAIMNLKACEKLLREMPDSDLAYQAVARCHLAMDDLVNKDKALEYLEKAWFLQPKNILTARLYAKTAKELGKSVILDSVSHYMILLEPELTLSLLQS